VESFWEGEVIILGRFVIIIKKVDELYPARFYLKVTFDEFYVCLSRRRRRHQCVVIHSSGSLH